MREFISIHEMRRRAPFHYMAKADNTRFVAFLLSQSLSKTFLEKEAEKANYGGTPWVALMESLQREMALSLELVIKAVIALKIEAGVAPKFVKRVRPVHELLDLWGEAGLPSLNNNDKRLILRASQILKWSGRYAAPKTDEQFYNEERKDQTLKAPIKSGALRLEKWIYMDWKNFERFYGIAFDDFWLTRKKYYKSEGIDLG